MDGRTRLLVIASLVVNLFLAGALVGVLIVGMKMMDGRDDDDRRGGDRPGMWSAFQAIPQERRQVLRSMLREPAIAAAPDMRAARDARRRAASLIAAPTYDAAAVQAAFKEARDRESMARAKIDEALAGRLAELTPEERAAFGQVMVRGPRGFDGDRDRDRDRRRGDGPPAPPAADGPSPAR